MDRVLFYDDFGMIHVPNRLFNNLSEAEQYAFDNGWRVGKKVTESEVDK